MMTTATLTCDTDGMIDGLHPIHHELTCTEAEDATSRAWAKVSDLNTHIAALTDRVRAAETQYLTVKAERDELVNAVTERDELETRYLALDDTCGTLLATLAAAAPATAWLPTTDAILTDAWRTASGHTRGPVPAAWRTAATSPDAAARITAAITAAVTAAVTVEAFTYLAATTAPDA